MKLFHQQTIPFRKLKQQISAGTRANGRGPIQNLGTTITTMMIEITDAEIASGVIPVWVELVAPDGSGPNQGRRGAAEIGIVATLAEHAAVEAVALERMGELCAANDAIAETVDGWVGVDEWDSLLAEILAEGLRRAAAWRGEGKSAK